MGAKQTRLRQIYNNMKYRCYAPNLDERTAKAYRDKGIRVCEEWLGYYGNFESWALSHGYKSGLSIDRIDPNGNYCPENCRWVTVDENRARHGTNYTHEPEVAVSVLSEQEKTFAERMNELMSGLNDRGRERLLDIAKGYEMCLRDNQLDRPSAATVPRPTA